MTTKLPDEYEFYISHELRANKDAIFYKLNADNNKTYLDYNMVMKVLKYPTDKNIQLLFKENYLNRILDQQPTEFHLGPDDIYNGKSLFFPKKHYLQAGPYKGISISDFYEKRLDNLLDELIISTNYNTNNYIFTLKRFMVIIIAVLNKIKLFHAEGYSFGGGLSVKTIYGSYNLTNVVITNLNSAVHASEYSPEKFEALKLDDIKVVLGIFMDALNSLPKKNTKSRSIFKILGRKDIDIQTIIRDLRKLDRTIKLSKTNKFKTKRSSINNK